MAKEKVEAVVKTKNPSTKSHVKGKVWAKCNKSPGCGHEQFVPTTQYYQQGGYRCNRCGSTMRLERQD